MKKIFSLGLWLGLITSDTVAQLCMKSGAAKSIEGWTVDWRVAIGYSFVIVSFLIWMQILKTMRLSLALSATSLNYVTVALGAHYLLDEPINPTLLAGCALIGLGVFLLGLAESNKLS
jgi:drug/metabolite transporter (DMT)-like permease